MRISMPVTLALVVAVWLLAAAEAEARKSKKNRAGGDPYAEYVWPPPPDEPRIRLTEVLRGRADVEATSHWRRILIGSSPQSPFDRLTKPFAVAFDSEGRILVTESARGAVIRRSRSSSTRALSAGVSAGVSARRCGCAPTRW